MARRTLSFIPEAEDDLARLDKQLKGRVIDKMDWLRANFEQIIPLPLGSGWQVFKVPFLGF